MTIFGKHGTRVRRRSSPRPGNRGEGGTGQSGSLGTSGPGDATSPGSEVFRSSKPSWSRFPGLVAWVGASAQSVAAVAASAAVAAATAEHSSVAASVCAEPPNAVRRQTETWRRTASQVFSRPQPRAREVCVAVRAPLPRGLAPMEGDCT